MRKLLLAVVSSAVCLFLFRAFWLTYRMHQSFWSSLTLEVHGSVQFLVRCSVYLLHALGTGVSLFAAIVAAVAALVYLYLLLFKKR